MLELFVKYQTIVSNAEISWVNILFSIDFRGKVMKLQGACPESQALLAQESTKLRFFVNRDLETEIGISVSCCQ